MAQITRDNGYGTTYRFEVVEKVPADYLVWNVRVEWADGYILFCQLIEGTYSIKRDTLLAIKVDDIEIRELLHDASHRGISNLAKAKRWVNNYSTKKGAFARLTLPIFEALTERN